MLDFLEQELLKKKFHPVHLIVLSFALIILFGSLLLYLPISLEGNQRISYVDALFTSTSATDVTGLVALDLNHTFNWFGKLVILLLIQIGGLGYMAIATFVFLIIGRRISLKHRLFLGESLNRPSLEQIIVFAKYIFGYVFMFEFIGAILLYLRLSIIMDPINAVKHSVFLSISAFNNAGLDLLGNFKSLTIFAKDPFVLIIISFLIICGGIGFIVLGETYDKLKGSHKKYSLHSKIVILTTIFLILFGTIAIFATEYSNNNSIGTLSLSEKILHSYFQSVTARTAGFNSINIGGMTKIGLLFIMILMFIGASPGGTGGGIKTTTFSILLAGVTSATIEKEHTEIMGRRIPWQTISKSIAIFFLSLVLVFFVSIQISAIEPFSLLAITFEVISAFGTVGLSTGITPLLTDFTKILLIITMFIGRIGPLTIAMFFIRKKANSKVILPEEDISVG